MSAQGNALGTTAKKFASPVRAFHRGTRFKTAVSAKPLILTFSLRKKDRWGEGSSVPEPNVMTR
jgi:hypothetical protein